MRKVTAKHVVIAVCLYSGLYAASSEIRAQCEPLGFDKNQLITLREAGFQLTDTALIKPFLLGLLDCLADPDPFFRDQVGYEGFTALLRSGQVDPETVELLRTTLLEKLAPGAGTAAGFMQPFAALVLAEVARVDRITPVFTDEALQDIVHTASRYMQSIMDYRGFDAVQGWRHAVAHCADLMLQLVLNERFDRSQLTLLRNALATQIIPANGHSYIFGESARLARPVIYMAASESIDAADWEKWFDELLAGADTDDGMTLFQSTRGLAVRHNLIGFAQAVYVASTVNDDDRLEPLRAGAQSILRAMR